MSMRKIILCVALALVMLLPAWGRGKPRIVPGWAGVLNLVPGFGVGSFIQNDWVGGCTQLALELGSIAVLAAADIHWGLSLFALGMAWGILRPMWFADDFNPKLQRNKVTFEVAPALGLCAGGWVSDSGFEVAVRFALD